MSASLSLPPNAHISKHPCLQAKLSQLRVKQSNARETKLLIHEIATIVAVEALASCLQGVDDGQVGQWLALSSSHFLLQSSAKQTADFRSGGIVLTKSTYDRTNPHSATASQNTRYHRPPYR